jgi:hypothetical protein
MEQIQSMDKREGYGEESNLAIEVDDRKMGHGLRY